MTDMVQVPVSSAVRNSVQMLTSGHGCSPQWLLPHVQRCPYVCFHTQGTPTRPPPWQPGAEAPSRSLADIATRW